MLTYHFYPLSKPVNPKIMTTYENSFSMVNAPQNYFFLNKHQKKENNFSLSSEKKTIFAKFYF